MALVFAAPFFSLSFSRITLPGIQAVNATQDLLPLYGEDHSAVILSIGNYSKWSLNPSPSTGAALTTSMNSLTLKGTFPVNSNPSAVSISRSLVANITQYPTLYVQMNVSKGVSYGIRFYSQNSDGTFALWKDTDVLNHRQGTGQPENVQVNMIQVIEANTNKSLDSLSRATVYVERGPGTNPIDFSLQLSSFKFLSYRLEPAQSRGLYHAIYLTLSLTAPTSSLLTLQSIRVEGHLEASTNAAYVLYLIDKSGVYRGGTYAYDPSTPDQVYVVSLREKLNSFSDNLPTAVPSVVIVSASGTLYQFNVKSMTLNYMSRVEQSSSLPPSKDPSSKDPSSFYLAIFVFLPIAIAVLLYDHFRRTRFRRSVQRQFSKDLPRE